MQMLYNSDNYAVVQIDVPAPAAGDGPHAPVRGGYEIVDKHARREIFIEGALAERFKAGVEALAQGSPSQEDLDDYVCGYASLAHQPVTLH